VPAIDCHAHVFSAEAPAVEGARYRPAYAATLDAWKARWRASGITHGVLVQPSFLGTDNRELLAALASDPEHLRGVAVVDPSLEGAALRELGACGVVALRLNLHGIAGIAPYFEGEWRALLDRCARAGWHLEVFTDAGMAPRVARLLEAVAIDVVFDHFAVPDAARVEETYDALARLARSRAVWCKLSAPYRIVPADADRCASRCIAALGPGRVVWGSDWPFTRHEAADYADLRRRASAWAGSREEALLWDNAARLYRFG